MKDKRGEIGEKCLLTSIQDFPNRIRGRNWIKGLPLFIQYLNVLKPSLDIENSTYIVVSILNEIEKEEEESSKKSRLNHFLEDFSKETLLKTREGIGLEDKIKLIAKSNLADKEIKGKGISWMFSQMNEGGNEKGITRSQAFIGLLLDTLLETNDEIGNEDLDIRERALIVKAFWSNSEMYDKGDFEIIKGLFGNTVIACYTEEDVVFQKDLLNGLQTASEYLSKDRFAKTRQFVEEIYPQIDDIAQRVKIVEQAIDQKNL